MPEPGGPLPPSLNIWQIRTLLVNTYVYVHFLTKTADITSNDKRRASGCNFNIMKT